MKRLLATLLLVGCSTQSPPPFESHIPPALQDLQHFKEASGASRSFFHHTIHQRMQQIHAPFAHIDPQTYSQDHYAFCIAPPSGPLEALLMPLSNILVERTNNALGKKADVYHGADALTIYAIGASDYYQDVVFFSHGQWNKASFDDTITEYTLAENMLPYSKKSGLILNYHCSNEKTTLEGKDLSQLPDTIQAQMKATGFLIASPHWPYTVDIVDEIEGYYRNLMISITEEYALDQYEKPHIVIDQYKRHHPDIQAFEDQATRILSPFIDDFSFGVGPTKKWAITHNQEKRNQLSRYFKHEIEKLPSKKYTVDAFGSCLSNNVRILHTPLSSPLHYWWKPLLEEP